MPFHPNAATRFGISGNAIVTGGAGGIGLPSCRALLEHGLVGLAIFDTPSAFQKSESAILALQRDFPDTTILSQPVDVRSEAEIQAAVDDTASTLGSVDILLCCAGIASIGPSADFPLADWKNILDVNTTGSWLCAQIVGRKMIAQGTGGNLIFIASQAGHDVLYTLSLAAYCTSKAAIKHTAQCLAAEWAKHGIRVNSISPGWVNTPMAANIDKAVLLERVPMGRFAEPDEIVGAVIFLCSPAGRYVTGTDILVTGGGHVY